MKASNILRFGIPSLDELFGGKDSAQARDGILLPGGSGESQSSSSISLCISGPDGTGKSVLGLHLASCYLADCNESGAASTRILYVSTDLKFEMAEKMWINFGLDYPNRRTIPFADQQPSGGKDLRINLRPCTPFGIEDEADFFSSSEAPAPGNHPPPATTDKKSDRKASALARYFVGRERTRNDKEGEVYFVDLASYTAGDDWGYVNRVLSILEKPENGDPRHLIVFDSVEGFEILVGDRDAYGEMQPRRSRIAQVMRSAAEKCHALLIIEEPEEGKRLPEEFVTDVVLRLRSVTMKDYVRRTIELEKVRGHSHIRGQHSYMIRSGKGSTTGNQVNPDDPCIPAVAPRTGDEHVREPFQSYLHVCQSLHSINRGIMVLTGKGRPARPRDGFAAFGIHYLDDMLGGRAEDAVCREAGNDNRGLPGSTVTALIGNSETKKSPLGVAFLSRCFTEYAKRFLAGLANERNGTLSGCDTILEQSNNRKQKTILERLKAARVPESGAADDLWQKRGDYDELKSEPNISDSGTNPKGFKSPIAPRVIEAAMKLGAPNVNWDGVPVLLTTQDVNAQKLAHDFLPWLLQDLRQWVPQNQPKTLPNDGAVDFEKMAVTCRGWLAALRIMIEEYTVCRRLEIHDLPSAVLIHVVQRAVKEAQQILHREPIKDPEERFLNSGGIRVVFDDFSIVKNTYIEIRHEPLLVRFLVFYLRREGVTTLLIDTQSGRPDTITTSQLESELRSLVDHGIYTWRFPFLSESRVAISAIPPISPHAPAVTRELRVVANSYPQTTLVPLVVDPHLEFYSGIEQATPQPIPLEIKVFAESAAFADYFARENLRYRDLFTPLPRNRKDGSDNVIVNVPADEYDDFRDSCYIQADTRLDHTLILQVDEFWMVRRRRVRRTSAFRPPWHYLNTRLDEERKPQANLEDGAGAIDRKTEMLKSGWAADPFRIFEEPAIDRGKSGYQGTEQPAGKQPQSGDKHSSRAREFVWYGYHYYDNDELNEEKKEAIDRVPFMWDFGFLLCREDPWLEMPVDKRLKFWLGEGGKDRNSPDIPKNRNTGEFKTIRQVWDRMRLANAAERSEPRPSWRVFLEACYHVARAQTYARGTPVSAFDLPVALPQTLSCLILEIWASEIYEKLKRIDKRTARANGGKEEAHQAQNFLESMEWRELTTAEQTLTDWLVNHQVELFKTWLLLIEVLDMDEWADAIEKGDLRNRKIKPFTVAARHWYATACAATENLSYDERIVPVGLPGNFSTRGDWFLTVAGGSRSERLASLALDMLNSRRSNYERLAAGLGLPTRRIVEHPKLKTRILTVQKTEQEQGTEHSGSADVSAEEMGERLGHVLYDELISIGGPLFEKGKGQPVGDFHWLWRSRLNYYHRHARIWQDWICEMVLWWQYMRYVNRVNWINGFVRYDQTETDEESGKREGEALRKFKARCDRLADHLRQATPFERPHVVNTLPA